MVMSYNYYCHLNFYCLLISYSYIDQLLRPIRVLSDGMECEVFQFRETSNDHINISYKINLSFLTLKMFQNYLNKAGFTRHFYNLECACVSLTSIALTDNTVSAEYYSNICKTKTFRLAFYEMLIQSFGDSRNSQTACFVLIRLQSQNEIKKTIELFSSTNNHIRRHFFTRILTTSHFYNNEIRDGDT